MPKKPKQKLNIEKLAKAVYEACRIESLWSERPIVPEPWDNRDEGFRSQFTKNLCSYLQGPLPTPEEAHTNWMKAYLELGWTYGPVRDPNKKTHPDLVPYKDLPQAEKDKDAIFLSYVWLIKQLFEVVVKHPEEGGNT